MKKLDIGVLVGLNAEPEAAIERVADLGLNSCQVCSWDPDVWTDDAGEKLTAVCTRLGIRVSTFWAGYTGPAVWNFIEGPTTIGLVPEQYRAHRTEELKLAATFAAKVGLPSITTHVGFFPLEFVEKLAALVPAPRVNLIRYHDILAPAARHRAAVIPAFVDAALDGRPVTVHGDGTQSRDFTYVGTVTATIVEAILGRVTSPVPLNLAFGSRISLLDTLD